MLERVWIVKDLDDPTGYASGLEALNHMGYLVADGILTCGTNKNYVF